MSADNADYPEIDWPVGEMEDWTFLRSERKDRRIRFLWETNRGPAWTPWVNLTRETVRG